ncbi:unnamed protein product [Arctia plantaginis]|uniref:Uncharacterized protein n=1 Tax=Arctia plantaginis TaxID=874455 RepID=A0A8S1AFE2_ARCPL|nr:unnamed protein product [Arctia plantaginis]CAB3253624.1 unnamed protein product [Arctia plantaginis]
MSARLSFRDVRRERVEEIWRKNFRFMHTRNGPFWCTQCSGPVEDNAYNVNDGGLPLGRIAISASGRRGAVAVHRMPIAPRGPPPISTPPYHLLLRRRPSLTLKCPSII